MNIIYFFFYVLLIKTKINPQSEVPTDGNTPVTSEESVSATGSTEHSREGVGVGCEAQEGRVSVQ